MKTSNASIFRRHAIAEEHMIRSSMPETSARDLAPLFERRSHVVVASTNGTRLVRTLTASLSERTVAA